MAAKTRENIREKVVRRALALAAEKGGWAQVGLRDIARSSKISLSQLQTHFEDKDDILVALGRMIDNKVLQNAGTPDMDIPPRDRLFDVLMERFEAMGEYRAGLKAVLRSLRPDPKQAVIAFPHLCRSMTWMLEAAGIETGGLRGAVKVAGLTIVFLNVLRTWAGDETEDLGKTMAALDRNLARAVEFAGTLGL